jgi:hypothetical protein
MSIITAMMGFIAGFLHNIRDGAHVYSRPLSTIMHGVISGLLFSLCVSIIENIIPYVTCVSVVILLILIVYHIYRLNF